MVAAQREFGVKPWDPGPGHVSGLTDALAEKNRKANGKIRMELLAAVNRAACNRDAARWARVQKAHDKFNRNP